MLGKLIHSLPFRLFVIVGWLLSLYVFTDRLIDPSPVPEDLKPDPSIMLIIAKIVHLLGYAWCTFWGLWLWQNLNWRIWFATFMIAHGILTELIQSYIPTRTGSWRDVGIDTVGVFLGVFLIWVWHQFPEKYTRKQDS